MPSGVVKKLFEELLHKFDLVKLFWSIFASLQLSLVQPNSRRKFLCLVFCVLSTVVLLKIKLNKVNNYLKYMMIWKEKSLKS